MFKMSTCGVGLLLAGLVGLACSTTGPSDCEKAGGTCDPITPGGCLGGWSPNTDGYSCGSSTSFCCFPLSYSPCETAGGTCVWTAGTCPSGTVDDTSQYQWSQYECSSAGGPSICCMPSTDGGAGAALDGATADAELSCSLSASQYDNSCTIDSDCVGVPFGDPCAGNCSSICPTSALNARVAYQYLTDLKALMAGGTENAICNCPCIPLQPCCRQGVCYNMCGECSGTN